MPRRLPLGGSHQETHLERDGFEPVANLLLGLAAHLRRARQRVPIRVPVRSRRNAVCHRRLDDTILIALREGGRASLRSLETTFARAHLLLLGGVRRGVRGVVPAECLPVEIRHRVRRARLGAKSRLALRAFPLATRGIARESESERIASFGSNARFSERDGDPRRVRGRERLRHADCLRQRAKAIRQRLRRGPRVRIRGLLRGARARASLASFRREFHPSRLRRDVGGDGEGEGLREGGAARHRVAVRRVGSHRLDVLLDVFLDVLLTLRIILRILLLRIVRVVVVCVAVRVRRLRGFFIRRLLPFVGARQTHPPRRRRLRRLTLRRALRGEKRRLGFGPEVPRRAFESRRARRVAERLVVLAESVLSRAAQQKQIAVRVPPRREFRVRHRRERREGFVLGFLGDASFGGAIHVVEEPKTTRPLRRVPRQIRPRTDERVGVVFHLGRDLEARGEVTRLAARASIRHRADEIPRREDAILDVALLERRRAKRGSDLVPATQAELQQRAAHAFAFVFLPRLAWEARGGRV